MTFSDKIISKLFVKTIKKMSKNKKMVRKNQYMQKEEKTPKKEKTIFEIKLPDYHCPNPICCNKII